MTSRDFCFWLQGFMELHAAGQSEPRPHDAPELPDLRLNAAQTRTVKNHLALVFKHEIDPSMGGTELQKQMQKIHDLNKQQAWQNDQNQGLGLGPQARC